jgi:hypothetical protein
LRFDDDQGISGSVALSVGDTRASYDARVELPHVGVVVVHDDDLAAPRGPLLMVRGEGIWAEFVCETAGEHWSFGLEAFGVRFDDAEEAASSDRGDRVAVGLDLEWETPDHVYGDILIGVQRLEFDGTGAFVAASLD